MHRIRPRSPCFELSMSQVASFLQDVRKIAEGNKAPFCDADSWFQTTIASKHPYFRLSWYTEYTATISFSLCTTFWLPILNFVDQATAIPLRWVPAEVDPPTQSFEKPSQVSQAMGSWMSPNLGPSKSFGK